MTEAAPTSEQLSERVGSDGDENAAATSQPAPAASPLGTDDEAGGTPPTAERLEMARKAEERIREAASKQK